MVSESFNRYPDFIIGGVPKAGTTSLWQYLNQHPGIWFPEKKEPHFFSLQSDGWPYWGSKTTTDYLSLFPEQKETGILYGEASTWYLYGQNTAKEIFRFNPSVKMIFLIRNPVDRAWSSFTFRKSMGWEPLSFSDAVKMESTRIARGEDWDFHYLNAGLYYNQLKRYFDIFPQNQLLVLRFDDLIRSTSLVVNQSIEFLGLGESPIDYQLKAHNETRFQPMRPKGYFAKSPVIRYLKKIIPAPVKQTVTSLFEKKPGKLNPVTAGELREYFREDILKTSGLIGMDLNSWLKPAQEHHG